MEQLARDHARPCGTGGTAEAYILTLWEHELDAYDWSNDVYDDVVEQEAAVGNQQGHKGDDVGVNASVHQNLAKNVQDRERERQGQQEQEKTSGSTE